jgi:tetratricopeptide (TPR) repeat protein
LDWLPEGVGVTRRFAVLGSVTLLLLAEGVYGQGSATRPEASDPGLQKGIGLYQRKEYSKARDVFLRVTQLQPRYAAAFFYLGISQVGLGDLPKAEISLRRALELDPGSASTVYNLGVVLLDEKKAAEAAAFLERSYREGPVSPEVTANLVRCYLDLGKTDQAGTVAEAAGRRYEHLPAFYLAVGKLFASHGLAKRARPFLAIANRLAPASPEVVMPLAAVDLQLKDSAHALQALEGISTVAQGDAYFHFLLGEAHFLAGQKEAALSQMNQAVEIDNRNPAYLLTLARYYQKYGDQRQAVEVLRKAAQANPTLAEIPYSLAVSYFIADDYDNAAGYLDRAIQLQPDFDRAVYLLACARAAQGKWKEAERLLGRAIQMQPQNPFYPCTLGMILVTENRLDEAVASLQKSLSLKPDYALAHYQFGRVLSRQGANEKARQELEQAVAVQPNLVEAWYQLSQTYQRLGMKAEAAQAMTKFRQYRSAQYHERQELLEQIREAVTSEP